MKIVLLLLTFTTSLACQVGWDDYLHQTEWSIHTKEMSEINTSLDRYPKVNDLQQFSEYFELYVGFDKNHAILFQVYPHFHDDGSFTRKRAIMIFSKLTHDEDRTKHSFSLYIYPDDNFKAYIGMNRESFRSEIRRSLQSGYRRVQVNDSYLKMIGIPEKTEHILELTEKIRKAVPAAKANPKTLDKNKADLTSLVLSNVELQKSLIAEAKKMVKDKYLYIMADTSNDKNKPALK